MVDEALYERLLQHRRGEATPAGGQNDPAAISEPPDKDGFWMILDLAVQGRRVVLEQLEA